MSVPAPTLHTERLILRGHTPDDLADCVALWTDPQVTRYTTRHPLSRQEVWTRLLRHPGHWALLGFGYWLVFERQTGRFVGEMGLANFYRTLLEPYPEYGQMPEAGWVLLPWAHGQGYASEALTAILDWRDQNLPAERTFCLIDPKNAPSLRLAGKFGFEPRFTIRQGEIQTVVLERAKHTG